MKVFVTGVSGLLGLNVAIQLRDRFEIIGCYRQHPLAIRGVRAFQCDISNGNDIAKLLEEQNPSIIVHAAGLASVEECEANPVLAFQLNVDAAATVARTAHTLGARLIHISTDHVFDGTTALRSEVDAVFPLNVYARTKVEAEGAVLAACPDALVARTNFFGWGTSRRQSLSDWVLHGLRQSRQLRMFNDVFFTPLLINDLVDRSIALIDHGASGIVHVGGRERLSKYEFGLRIARTFGYPEDGIVPIGIDTLGLTAARPRDMSLSSSKAEQLLRSPAPSLQESLSRLHRLGIDGWPQELEVAATAPFVPGL